MIKSYNEMPIATYNKLMAIAKSSKNQDRRATKIIAHISGKSEDELLRMEIPDYAAYKTINFAWLAEQPRLTNPAKAYKIGEFNCVFVHPSKWTAFQHITFNQYAQEYPNEMQYAISAALVPRTKEGFFGTSSYDLNRLQKAIAENLPITECQAIMATLWDYSKTVKDKELRKERKSLKATMRKVKAHHDQQKQIDGAVLSIDALRCEWWMLPSLWKLELPELIGNL